MNTQFLGILHLTDNNGNPAVGYKIWAYAPGGTTTPANTYPDESCTPGTENAWPIVLNARGEPDNDVWINTETSFYYTIPTATDVISAIWGPITVGKQQGVPPISAILDGTTTHNNYNYTSSPVTTSLSDLQSIKFKPDKDSVATIGTQVFTGTGINDGVFSGPYVGTTSGSIFTVQIDGVGFQGSGLNDITWGGTPILGSVYTVKISTAAATDKFQWRKNGGAWSAEISITGAAQALTDGVTITFPATTGHTLADLWNNVDTFKWKKDGGAWTAGVAITALLQILGGEGVGITFPVKNGHTLNDLWAVPVETPVRFNFCILGNWIVYKNVAGTLKALDAGDLKQDIPSTITASTSQSCYILDNPSLPVLVEIQPQFVIHEIKGNYTVTSIDARHFLNCSNSAVITMETCAKFANKDFWVASQDGTQITVNVAGGTDKIYLPFNPVGVTTITIGAGGWDRVRFASNGVYYEIVEAISLNHGFAFYTNTNDGESWTCPDGVIKAKVTIIPPGGGGGSTDDNTATYYGAGGGAGGARVAYVTTVPRTNYLLTIPLGGSGAAAGTTNKGNTGATASLGALLSGTGGEGGEGGDKVGMVDGKGGAPGNDTGTAGTDGTFGPDAPGGKQYFGQLFGSYGNGGAASHDQTVPGVNGEPAAILIEW